MKEHHISLSKRQVTPFSDRIIMHCNLENSFLSFKNRRGEIMADKKAYMTPEEPFHLQMLRKQKKDKEEKDLAEKGFWGVKKAKNDDVNSESSEDMSKASKSVH